MTDAPKLTPFSPLYGAFRWMLQIAAFAGLFWGAPAGAQPARILAFGDSLTASPGVIAEDALAQQLQRKLKADGYDVEVIGAGVSGDTTTTGLARLDFTLGGGPIDIAIVELGANDMLGGRDPGAARSNLDQIIGTMKGKGIRVLLAAMASSNNWGQAYKKDFDSIYPDLAAKHGVMMIPFFLEGVWGQPSMLIGDGIHPNAAGIAKIVAFYAPYVKKELDALGVKKASQMQ